MKKSERETPKRESVERDLLKRRGKEEEEEESTMHDLCDDVHYSTRFYFNHRMTQDIIII